MRLPEELETGFAAHNGAEEKTGFYEEVERGIDRNQDGSINLAEFMFLRRASSGWRQCVSGNAMN